MKHGEEQKIEKIQYAVHRSRDSMDIQYNGQSQKDKRQTMMDKTLHRKLMIEKHESDLSRS